MKKEYFSYDEEKNRFWRACCADSICIYRCKCRSCPRGGNTCFSTVNKHGVSISANAEEEQISKDHFKYIEETETVVNEKTGEETAVPAIRITGYDLEGASGYSKFEAIKEGKKTIGYKMVLPSEINGIPVTAIGNSAFEDYSQLIAVEIPASVKMIGRWAFHNTGLTEIDIPENVQTIQYQAFGFDRQEDEEGNRLDAPLTKITLHNGLEKIENSAFYGSSITSIDIPYTLTEGSGAFSECDKLAQVNFLTDENGNAMQKIPASLLEGCKSLTAIELPAKGLKEIGSWAFKNTGLTEIDIPGNVKTIGYQAFKYDADAENKSPLTKITLNEGLVSIGEGAFANAQITELHIPSTLWECGSSPFGQCYQLKKVTFADQLFKIPEHLLENCTALEEVELSEKVDTIGQSAFAGCNSLTKVVIPDAYCRIDSWAFENTDCVVYSTVDADAEEGAQTVQNYTAENNVKFESLGDYTQPDPYYGDLNKDGSVDIVDVLIVNKAVLGVEHVTWQQTERGDVDKGDNGERMDSTDSLNILKYIVKIIEDFSALVK